MTTKPDKPNIIWAANGTNTDPGDQLFEQGWPFTDGQGNPQPPEAGVMNYIQNKSSQFLAHVNEYGIPQWDADTVYPLGAYTSSSVTNRVYISTSGNNQNNEPSSGVDWVPFGAVGGIGDTLVSYSGDVDMESRGFLPQDGRAISRTTYSELFALIGTTFGSGDGSTTFNLPTKGQAQQPAFSTVANNPHPSNEIYYFKKDPTKNELLVAFEDIATPYVVDLDTDTWSILPTPTGTGNWASKSPAFPNNPQARFVYWYGNAAVVGGLAILCRVDNEDDDFIYWYRNAPGAAVDPGQWVTSYVGGRAGFNVQPQILSPIIDKFADQVFDITFNYLNNNNGQYQFGSSSGGAGSVLDPSFFNPPAGDYVLSNNILVEKNTGKTYWAKDPQGSPQVWSSTSNNGPFNDLPDAGGTITNASMLSATTTTPVILMGPNSKGEYFTKTKYNIPTNNLWIKKFRYIAPDAVRCWDYSGDNNGSIIYISVGSDIIYSDNPATEIFNDYIKVSA